MISILPDCNGIVLRVEITNDLLNATTPLPALAFWCNALGESETYALLVERVVCATAKVLERFDVIALCLSVTIAA